ncbi:MULTISPECIES: distal tail protein Dit [Geobacillus]|uniref:distal tail protein Dit n=1 Tax=Geobacillus TaxID=129337 RepID=UPI0006E4D1DA|nr:MULTISPECIES: distal tail protein Dit [Geobacillus]KQB92100.1 phage tail protein [Geobacillus sp. PA-3]MED0662189.1 phage tail protein [Geobacillus thermodenitrificans]MED4917548.1 phage tail family protein [Geobacillus thermodenitrificans]
MITYDGFDLSTYLLVRNIGRPLMPPQEITYMSIPGRHGAYFLEKRHEPVVIPVEVVIYEHLDLSYSELKRLLAGKLNKSEPKPIIFDDEPDRYINGIIQDQTEIRELIRAGEGTLNFFCPDPCYYAIEDEVFEFSGAGVYVVNRQKGNEYSEPLIEIQGTCSGGAIGVRTPFTSVRFTGTLKQGETLVFDSHFITSYILDGYGNKRPANQYLDSMDFPFLDIEENEVEFLTEGNATIEKATVYARSRWI